MGITKSQKLAVRAYVGLLARVERVPHDDPRIEWVTEQAEVCVLEGMGPGEAVHLAAVVAFRRFGRERPAG